MKFIPQLVLENDQVILYPLQEEDFENLFDLASNPRIWEQHPNKDRWRRDVFRTFFDGAVQSRGAYKIMDKATGKIAGSSRFYDYNQEDNSILIGYTFFGTQYWGKGFNPTVKTLMLDYLFSMVSRVDFHIGAENIRSQKAIEKLGARKVDEREVTYFGEPPKLNFVYRLEKEEWRTYP